MLKIIGSVFLFGALSAYADTVPVRQRAVQEDNRPYVKVEVVANKKNVVTSEAVPYSIRVIFDSRTAEVVRITPPSIRNAQSDQLTGPDKQQKMINNRHCTISTWHGVVYPNQTGQLEMPPVQVEYVNKLQNKRSHYSMLSGFFSAFDRSTTTIHSQPVYIRVEPLDRSVKRHGGLVGSVSSAEITLDREHVSRGDAVLVRYTILGSGNIAYIDHPPLVFPEDISEDLRWYSSESKLVQGGRVFEYVVQPQKEGFFVFPAQKLRYFDTDLRKVRDLRTAPQSLQVQANTRVHAIEDDLKRDQTGSVEASLLEGSEDLGEQLDAQKTAVYQRSSVRRLALPEKLFWFLLGAMALFGSIRAWSSELSGLVQRALQFYKRRMLFIQIRRLLKKIDHKKLHLEQNLEQNDEQPHVYLYSLFQKVQKRVNWHRVQRQDHALFTEWQYCWRYVLRGRFGKELSIPKDFKLRSERVLHRLEAGTWFL